jgi:ABC-type sugar transport system ATPase subunit
MGADTWVTVELALTRVVARCEGAATYRPGDEVGLHFPHSKLHWFDAATGLTTE